MIMPPLRFSARSRLGAVMLACLGLTSAAVAEMGKAPSQALSSGELLPTGARITPLAMPGATFRTLAPDLPQLPDFVAGQPVEIAISPDGKTMLVLTSGYNRNFGPDGKPIATLSNEYVFVFDVAGREAIKTQVIQVPDTFLGMVWQPDSTGFLVSGGVDDNIHFYASQAGKFVEAGAPLSLGHKHGNGIGVKPMAGGLAISPDGARALVANVQNDSVSLIDLASRKVIAEQDLRPGKINPKDAGKPGGSFPLSVAFLSDTSAYVGALRDREIIRLDIKGDAMTVAKRIAIQGEPVKLRASLARRHLYVAADNSDTVVVIDPASDRVVSEFSTVAPVSIFANPQGLHGASPNNLAFSPDGRTLYVTNGGLNDVAVIALGRDVADTPNAAMPATSHVAGLIPTGWYPEAVAISAGRLFAVNGKSNAGPNLSACLANASPAADASNACKGTDEYIWQLSKGGLLSMPLPKPVQLAALTLQAARNNHFPVLRDRGQESAIMQFLHAHIRHVVYIVKENRTYDQVLGDLPQGDGDPTLTLFPAPITPNHHALASNFVTLDHFLDSGETSNTGWLWTTAARGTDYSEKNAPVNYAGRGLQYDQEGNNRNVNVGIASLAKRRSANPNMPDDPDMMAGTQDVAAPDADVASKAEAGSGYLWDSALRAGLSIRNYGFFGDLSRYFAKDATLLAPIRDPFLAKESVFFTTKAALAPYTDPYFRGFDMNFPDFYREREWQREFAGQVASGKMPNLTLLRLPHDHFGAFGTAVDGINTPELQIADNDLSIGKVVATIAHSRFASSTLIFIVEDDAQNGADHVDAHRSLLLVAGPYVRHKALVSTPYDTVNLLRTIEDILGLAPMGLEDGAAKPMVDIFDTAQKAWHYDAATPQILKNTALPLADLEPMRKGDILAPCFAAPTHDARYWAKAMQGEDFDIEDHLDVDKFNAALWRGLKGDNPPTRRSHADLQAHRPHLLHTWRQQTACAR